MTMELLTLPLSMAGMNMTGNFLRQKVAQAQQTEQEVLLAKQREEAEQNAAPPAGG